MVRNPISPGSTGRSRAAKRDNPGYDNPRENIDPHIKTKAVSTKEVDCTDFKLRTSPTNTYILTTDANGVGTWQKTAVSEADYNSLSGAVVINTSDIIELSGTVVIISGASIFNNSNISALSGAYNTHAADASDPHTATLTQTNLIATSLSGGNMFVTSDYTTESGAYVANVAYGADSTPPTASGFTRGTLWIEYTP